MPLRKMGFLARAWADSFGIAEGWDLSDLFRRDMNLGHDEFVAFRYIVFCKPCAMMIQAESMLPKLLAEKDITDQEKLDTIAEAYRLFRQSGCPHWDHYQVMRDDPEIVSRIEKNADRLMAEARFPSAQADRTGFAKIIRDLEESIACRYLNAMVELSIDIPIPYSIRYRDLISREVRTYAVPAEDLQSFWERLVDKFEKTRPWPWREEVLKAQKSASDAHYALTNAIGWWRNEQVLEEVIKHMRKLYGGWWERNPPIVDRQLRSFWMEMAELAEKKWLSLRNKETDSHDE